MTPLTTGSASTSRFQAGVGALSPAYSFGSAESNHGIWLAPPRPLICRTESAMKEIGQGLKPTAGGSHSRRALFGLGGVG